MAMLKKIFETNKDIVINSDIDGFLCGIILQKYMGCRVVGFSDSKDKVWLVPEIENMDSPVYIDLYVARPNVICIEQHIIAFDKSHHNEIIGFGSKINPNIERERTFVGDMQSDYYHKYPFGTVHYLIALLAKEGILVSLPNLEVCHQVPKYGYAKDFLTTTAGHIILRADDALYSTLSPYRENALDWWNWLDPNHQIPAIESLRNYISSCDITRAKEYKAAIGAFFKGLGCDGQDGAFKNVTDDRGTILKKVTNYKDVICSIMGMQLDLPTNYKIHKGKYAITYARPGYDMSILHANNLYSYAFIFGPRPKYMNFSFTLDME